MKLYLLTKSYILLFIICLAGALSAKIYQNGHVAYTLTGCSAKLSYPKPGTKFDTKLNTHINFSLKNKAKTPIFVSIQNPGLKPADTKNQLLVQKSNTINYTPQKIADNTIFEIPGNNGTIELELDTSKPTTLYVYTCKSTKNPQTYTVCDNLKSLTLNLTEYAKTDPALSKCKNKPQTCPIFDAFELRPSGTAYLTWNPEKINNPLYPETGPARIPDATDACYRLGQNIKAGQIDKLEFVYK